MRIGIVVPGFCKDENDWCIPALTHLVQEFSGHAEIVIFSLRYPHEKSVYACRGATVHTFGGEEKKKLRAYLLLNEVVKTIIAEHARKPFDALHAFWAHEPGYVATTAAENLGIPVVVSVMGGELEAIREVRYGNQLHLSGRRLVRSTLRKAHRITVGSRHVFEKTKPFAGTATAGRILRVPLGVHPGLFNAPTAARSNIQSPLRLLHVGSLIPVKNQRMLLHAVQRVAREIPVHLTVIGTGPLLGELQQLATELNLARQISFLGEIPHHRLPEYYRQADLFLLTSLYEAQAMVVLEAGACGVPTVGTCVGLLPELQPAVCTIADFSPRAFAHAILDLAVHPQRLQSLRAQIHSDVHDNYPVPNTAARFVDIYRTLCESFTPAT